MSNPSEFGLSRYGWTESLDHAFAPYREAGLVPARIARVDRGLCDAVTESGPVRARLAATYSRLDSYRKLRRENAWAASRTDARLRAERGDRQKAITSHLRATYKFRDRQS
ncbi:hypothetical protein [Microbispora sp. NPDC049633]|uniref:hypothetical protein n=1 Tax=Microbispora sp. NPDC049633 TaxID=3154355 RepID=UPI00341F198E